MVAVVAVGIGSDCWYVNICRRSVGGWVGGSVGVRGSSDQVIGERRDAVGWWSVCRGWQAPPGRRSISMVVVGVVRWRALARCCWCLVGDGNGPRLSLAPCCSNIPSASCRDRRVPVVVVRVLVLCAVSSARWLALRCDGCGRATGSLNPA